ncbi:MAG: hypothetical protein ACOCUA_02950 [archaeon]
MIPLLEDLERVEYFWYVSDPVPAVGLWKRTGRYEMPIYQNTRGMGVFNALSEDEGSETDREPTDAFWDALEDVVSEGEIDAQGCEWYETEFIHTLLNVAAECDEEDLPTEIGQLFAYVKEGHHPDAGQTDIEDFEEGVV